ASGVLDAAASFKPSLIVLATHGATGDKRWVRGSVAERMLQRSKYPLLMVSPFAARGEHGFQRILVPVDGSAESAAILPLVRDVARASDAEVVLLHAVDERGEAEPEVAARVVSHERAKLIGLRTRALVRTGSAPAKILDTAESEKADLIALTTHGRSGPSRWLYGSVAELVVHHARTPLL